MVACFSCVCDVMHSHGSPTPPLTSAPYARIYCCDARVICVAKRHSLPTKTFHCVHIRARDASKRGKYLLVLLTARCALCDGAFHISNVRCGPWPRCTHHSITFYIFIIWWKTTEINITQCLRTANLPTPAFSTSSKLFAWTAHTCSRQFRTKLLPKMEINYFYFRISGDRMRRYSMKLKLILIWIVASTEFWINRLTNRRFSMN